MVVKGNYRNGESYFVLSTIHNWRSELIGLFIDKLAAGNSPQRPKFS